MVSSYFFCSSGTLFGILVQSWAKRLIQNFSPLKSFTTAILCLYCALSRLQWLYPTKPRRAPCPCPPPWASTDLWRWRALRQERPCWPPGPPGSWCSGAGPWPGPPSPRGSTLWPPWATVSDKPSHALPQPRRVSLPRSAWSATSLTLYYKT